MEHDRYQQNHVLYIIGIISLILCLGLLIFSLYIFPFLLLSWIYTVPDFIWDWKELLLSQYSYRASTASWLIFMAFFIPGLIFALIAYITSNKIENKIYGIEVEKPEKPVNDHRIAKETISLSSKIIFIVILIFIAVGIIQWLLYTPAVE